VGNGTTLAGIYSGFKDLLNKGKIAKVPKMVATSTRQGNPIIKSYKEKQKTILELNPSDIRESAVNEPLTNWRSYDGQDALNAIYESNGFADYASDSKMLQMARLVRREQGLNILPASASTLAVMTNLKKEDVVLKGLFIAILTGRDYH
jgi:threonine synthase